MGEEGGSSDSETGLSCLLGEHHLLFWAYNPPADTGQQAPYVTDDPYTCGNMEAGVSQHVADAEKKGRLQWS